MTTQQPSKPRRRGRVIRLVLLALVLAIVAVPVVAVASVVAASRGTTPPTSDAIIVLGAAQFDGRPQPILQARLDHARDLYEAGVAPRIITVGGKARGDRFTEAEAGKAYLVDEGVPSRRIVAVGEGRDTFTSLEAVAELMEARGWCTAVIVTDPFHLRRTTTMARDLGIDAVPSPVTSGPTVTGPPSLRYLARETGALMFYVTTQQRSVEPVVTGCAR